MAKILVVDDLPDMAEMIEIFLAQEGHEVTITQSPIKAEDLLLKGKFDLLITDILMPEENGLELIERIYPDLRAQNKIPGIIAISGGVKGLGVTTILKAAAVKVDVTLQKPFTKEHLVEAVNEILAQRKLGEPFQASFL